MQPVRVTLHSSIANSSTKSVRLQFQMGRNEVPERITLTSGYVGALPDDCLCQVGGDYKYNPGVTH